MLSHLQKKYKSCCGTGAATRARSAALSDDHSNGSSKLGPSKPTKKSGKGKPKDGADNDELLSQALSAIRI